MLSVTPALAAWEGVEWDVRRPQGRRRQCRSESQPGGSLDMVPGDRFLGVPTGRAWMCPFSPRCALHPHTADIRQASEQC